MPKVLMVNLGKCHTTDGKIGNKWCIVSKEEIEAGKPLSTKQIHVYVHKQKTRYNRPGLIYEFDMDDKQSVTGGTYVDIWRNKEDLLNWQGRQEALLGEIEIEKLEKKANKINDLEKQLEPIAKIYWSCRSYKERAALLGRVLSFITRNYL